MMMTGFRTIQAAVMIMIIIIAVGWTIVVMCGICTIRVIAPHSTHKRDIGINIISMMCIEMMMTCFRTIQVTVVVMIIIIAV